VARPSNFVAAVGSLGWARTLTLDRYVLRRACLAAGVLAANCPRARSGDSAPTFKGTDRTAMLRVTADKTTACALLRLQTTRARGAYMIELSRRSVNIILAEDDDGHALLMERNLRRGGIINAIQRARDGIELLDSLRVTGREGPDVIFLDINMPRLDGFEVLLQLKADPELRSIPVIMVTSTDSQKEINRAYQLGASSYVVKPVGVEAFIDRVRKLGLFLEVVELPDKALRQRH